MAGAHMLDMGRASILWGRVTASVVVLNGPFSQHPRPRRPWVAVPAIPTALSSECVSNSGRGSSGGGGGDGRGGGGGGGGAVVVPAVPLRRRPAFNSGGASWALWARLGFDIVVSGMPHLTPLLWSRPRQQQQHHDNLTTTSTLCSFPLLTPHRALTH
jgi:hypothetical protein